MTLPQRRKRELPRDWPQHLKWLKTLGCAVPRCNETPIVVVYLEPCDASAVPMCEAHEHHYLHIGPHMFGQLYGVDLQELAKALVRASDDRKLRRAVLEADDPRH